MLSIAYDLYFLCRNLSWDTAAALDLDVVGAAVPFATGLGAAYLTERQLVDIANQVSNV